MLRGYTWCRVVTVCKDHGVIAAKQMTKKGPGSKVTQLSLVCLTFEMAKLPLSISMGYQKYSVRTYVPDAILCFKCKRIGHIVNSCKGSERCVRCGGPQSFDQCTAKEEERKCARCGGPHSAAYEGCEEIKKQKLYNLFG